MTVRIEMPQLSSEGESAALVSWLVKVGDQVVEGEVIAELETDKSTVELEAPVSGTLAEIVVAAGTEEIEPGALLGVIEAVGHIPAVSPMNEHRPSLLSPPPPPSPSPSPPPSPPPPPPADSAAETVPPVATPLARRAAENHGMDLTQLEGSGPGGRILEADVLRNTAECGTSTSPDAAPIGSTRNKIAASPAIAQPVESSNEGPGASGYEKIGLSAMRKTIARRMTASKQEVPHFYLSVRTAMDAVLDFRARLNAELVAVERDARISVNDFVVRAAALSLRDVPEANVSYAGDAIHVYDHVDIAVAVATDGGLVTPVVRGADRKGLAVLAVEVRELAQRARAGRLRPDEYQNGTFTISNLGMYGIDTVYPILNPPQACILGVGAAEEQPIVREGEIEVGRVASITLAADHRALDGVVGARLLAAIRAYLEDPMTMML